jgi:hypothetical protein
MGGADWLSLSRKGFGGRPAVSGWVSEDEPSSWKRSSSARKTGADERMTEDPESV